ncbi:cell division protein FtsA [Keratinibaculum paraultunense]|uniref:Chaperone protein DnaK n=1 Tax=Keratinibaculum paraultunense TaxID=1278232 RepID=A0A4R3KY67_9FIRM|nr:cell division FtsA domain-containing protein [Keratinibaculum paraultunense]TCS90768.1 cell division protein FtsA [Keratinibaculum paraultunense]
MKNTFDDLVFSLDIGTRTIIGIVAQHTEDEKINILGYSIKEHDRRNMYDGQIHDIEGVTKIVEEIVEELEGKLNVKLKKVSIAAAGRSLKTCKVRVDKKIDETLEITKNMVDALELEAVQKAQNIVNEEQNNNKLKYYSIDYSVINYYLDDNVMTKLDGHRGEKIGVELLATFLPQMVIESLYTVISRAGLEVGTITLEPIAAINVAIKEDLRLLNLALVDIGAGTSDIAITKDGNIIAYAMTSKAGDEITEILSKKYLLDFTSSEKLKTQLNSKDKHNFNNIVGMKYELTTEEIVNDIYDIIDEISREIAEKILEFNGKAPSAVFLIGGSSQMPGLKECLAKNLGLPKERVSIRDISFIENIEGMDNNINGPDMITPIGIAIESLNKKYNNLIEIKFNGKEIRLFNVDKVKVSDILVLTGYNPRDLLPKLGEDFIYFVNGDKKTLTGGIGKPAEIYINNKIGNLNTSLQNGDVVEIKKGTKGEKMIPYLYDCIPREKIIFINEKPFNLIKYVKVNGIKIEGNPKLKEGDKIEIIEINTVEELLEYLNEDVSIERILLNGKKIKGNEKLEVNDQLLFLPTNNIHLIINGKEITIKHEKKEFLFVDIFNYIDFDLTKPKGKLVLKLNGEDAEYMAPLKDGDTIQIFWNK